MPNIQEASPIFCHLHLHSEYSLLDGAIRIQDLVSRAKNLGHTAVALTDHGNMFGAIEFYSACKSQGIKPILGCEIFFEGLPATREVLQPSLKTPGLDAFHLTLLASSTEGYHNLVRIVSFGHFHVNHLGIPIVKSQHLVDQSKDIIALSSCLRGEFGRLVLELEQATGNSIEIFQQAKNHSLSVSSCPSELTALISHVDFMKKTFGPRNYYVELIDNDLPIQKEMLPILKVAAAYFELPIVASCDAHYLSQDFATAHAVLTGIKNDLTISKMRHRNKTATFHVLDNEEMKTRFAAYPEALSNSLEIAERCNIHIEFGKFFLPDFDLKGEDINAALRRISFEGLQQRFELLQPLYGESFDEAKKQIYRDRLEYELGIIVKMGFPGYFLIVQDFINWAKDHDIPVGPGRGSGAGSLVAYALKITDLDPIKLNLIFERFLNPERISMPDFDVDFCQTRRDEVIDYVARKYGSGNVAQIVTFGKMKAKAALRDVGRVLEIGYKKVDRIAKLVPNELDIKLESALEQEPRILEEASKDSLIEDMLTIARQIEGLSRHTSVHAAGVVISNGAMENYVPVLKSEDGSLITQYEMKNAEKVGLVKFDFLGLKTLTVVKKAVDLIKANGAPDFNIETIDLEDRKVYENISLGNTCAIFQLESPGMRALNMKLKPSCFEDIIAVVALFRPGPLQSGMVDDFIERKHGRQDIVYSVPSLEPILKETYGIILYQEQVQKIAANLANYSLGEADILRRAMGKKKPEEMAKQKTRFLSGAVENKIPENLADELFELMAKFAAYGFNKSHSAAYGLVSYQTAYLKTHYPAEFMAAIMTFDMDNTEKMVRYIEDCKRLKITINTPNLNTSCLEFSVPEKGTINFALTAIKGIGIGPLSPIIEERDRNGSYKNLTDLAKRVNLHRVGKKTLELLNDVGALESFASREAVLKVIPEMVKYSENHHNAKSSGQGLLFAEDADEDTGLMADWEESLIKDTFVHEPLAWLMKEKKLLGVFLTGHPVHHFKEDVGKLSKISINQLEKYVNQKNLPLVAFLNSVSLRYTKSGKKMAYLDLEDATGSWEVVMFQNELPEVLPSDGQMIVCYLNVGKSFDGSSINVRAEKLFPLEQARRELTKSVTLNISAISEDKESLSKIFSRLHQIFQSNPGSTPVLIRLGYKKSIVTIKPKTVQIDLNDQCFQSIKHLNPDIVTLNIR